MTVTTRHGIRVAIALAVIALAVFWTAWPLRMEILTPRLGIPVIARAGETITATIKSPLPFYFPSIQWRLKTGARHYQLSESFASSGLARKVFILKLPENLESGSYSLIADYGAGELLEQPKTVHIIAPVQPEAFSIVQLADLPTLGGDGSGDRLLEQIIGEINIINPNVVLFTGDIAYGGGWDQYSRLADAMARVEAPVIAVAGNHEYEGWAGYLHYFVEPYHAVDYGRYKFISLNSGHGRDQMTQSQFRWLRAQLSMAREQTTIVQIHHPVRHTPGQRGYVQVNAEKLVSLFNHYRVPIVLSGHWHGDMVFDALGNERRDTWNFAGTPYVATTTAGADLRPEYSASPPHHGYRLIRLRGAELQSYTYDYDGDGERDPAASIPVGKLQVSWPDTRSAIVNNQLNEHLPDARIVLTVPTSDLPLQPNSGRIRRQTQRSDGQTDLEIIVDLPANATTSVILKSVAKERDG